MVLIDVAVEDRLNPFHEMYADGIPRLVPLIDPVFGVFQVKFEHFDIARDILEKLTNKTRCVDDVGFVQLTGRGDPPQKKKWP